MSPGGGLATTGNAGSASEDPFAMLSQPQSNSISGGSSSSITHGTTIVQNSGERGC